VPNSIPIALTKQTIGINKHACANKKGEGRVKVKQRGTT
jgi:hypothetical protein